MTATDKLYSHIWLWVEWHEEPSPRHLVYVVSIGCVGHFLPGAIGKRSRLVEGHPAFESSCRADVIEDERHREFLVDFEGSNESTVNQSHHWAVNLRWIRGRCVFFTPGAKGNLPSGYIVSFLWVLKQFARLIPSR